MAAKFHSFIGPNNELVKGQIFSKNMSVMENRGENKTRRILIAHKYVHYLSFNIYQEITF